MHLSTRASPILHIAGAVSTIAYAILAIASHQRASGLVWTLLICIGTTWIMTLATLRFACNFSSRTPFAWILAYGLLFRTIGFLANPILEDDFYRFLWDGHVFAQTGNPYGTSPSSYFGRVDLDERFEVILNQVNHPQIPTLYGPVFELGFLASYWIAPGKLWALKLIFLVCELAGFAVMRRWLSTQASVLWLWCPLLIQETAFSAHPDGLGLIAMSGALACIRGGGRAGIAGALLGLAVGARPFAILLLPFLCGHKGIRVIAGFAVTSALLHLPFLLVNAGPWAGLDAFAAHWEFNSAVFAVLQFFVGTISAKIVGGALYAVAYVWILWRWWYSTPKDGLIPGDLVFGLMLLVSPVINPWYLQWLVPFVAMQPRAWSIAFLITVTISYATFQNIDPGSDLGFQHPNWVRPVEFGVIALAGLYPYCKQLQRTRTGR